MMGLNYDWTSMNSLVDQMYPNGNTNQPIGLVWGWLSLVGGGPLTAPAMDSNYQYQQVIILLSDGLNTARPLVSTLADARVDNRMYRSAAAGHLRQHQGRRHHDLHHSGQHRRRSDLDAAAELRRRARTNSGC